MTTTAKRWRRRRRRQRQLKRRQRRRRQRRNSPWALFEDFDNAPGSGYFERYWAASTLSVGGSGGGGGSRGRPVLAAASVHQEFEGVLDLAQLANHVLLANGPGRPSLKGCARVEVFKFNLLDANKAAARTAAAVAAVADDDLGDVADALGLASPPPAPPTPPLAPRRAGNCRCRWFSFFFFLEGCRRC